MKKNTKNFYKATVQVYSWVMSKSIRVGYDLRKTVQRQHLIFREFCDACSRHLAFTVFVQCVPVFSKLTDCFTSAGNGLPSSSSTSDGRTMFRQATGLLYMDFSSMEAKIWIYLNASWASQKLVLLLFKQLNSLQIPSQHRLSCPLKLYRRHPLPCAVHSLCPAKYTLLLWMERQGTGRAHLHFSNQCYKHSLR